jgi:hypothetical protein
MRQAVVVNLTSVVDIVAARLKVEFEGTAEISHSASKGRVREALVLAEVLQRMLPDTVGLAHGAEIACSDGTVSGECDLVVYDRDIAPIYRSPSYSVLPIEGIMGVIEVKSRLNTAELESALNKLHEIKCMERSAVTFWNGEAHGQPWRRYKYRQWWDQPPISTYIVAFDSISLVTLAKRLLKVEGSWPREQCLDAAYVLWKGCLYDAADNPSGRCIVEKLTDRDMALGMVLEFVRQFQRRGVPHFFPEAYLGQQASFGITTYRFGTWEGDKPIVPALNTL